MAKKNFIKGLNAFFEKTAETNHNPREKNSPNTKYIRSTFLVEEKKLDSIKSIAYWQRCKIKDIVNSAFEQYIKTYEKNKGKIILPPKE